MDLKKILNIDVVTTDLQGENKHEVIINLLDLLMKSGKVIDREQAEKCIFERETKMSTGIQDGIAIPHGKTRAVAEMIACVGVKKGGIDFDALDNKPSRIFILTLSPEDRSGPHVQFLAQISQLIKDEEVRDRLINAKTNEGLLKIITE